jgi:hypothetical protein
VHVVDCDWVGGQPYPNSGFVRIQARDRKDLDVQMLYSDPVSGARLVVGRIENSNDLIMMGNFTRVTCEYLF